jgi:two-component system sensor histidine kinase/response regulator
MPEMDGFEAAATIRTRERSTGRHVRIVAMTAHAMAGDRERCLAAGMDAYLSKPIDPQALYATLEYQSAQLAPEDSTAPPAAPSAVDRDRLLKRLGYDEDLLLDVVQLFLEDCPVRLAAIKAAIDEGDAGALRTAAHALKGAAGNLSATGLFAAAESLEHIGAEARLDAADAAWGCLSREATLVLDTLRQFDPSPLSVVAPT